MKERIKECFRWLDQFLPDEIFTMVIKDFESDASLREKISWYLP